MQCIFWQIKDLYHCESCSEPCSVPFSEPCSETCSEPCFEPCSDPCSEPWALFWVLFWALLWAVLWAGIVPSLQGLLCFQVGKQTKRLLCWFLEWSWATRSPPPAITRVQGLFWNNLAASPSVGEVVVLLQFCCKAFSWVDDRDPWQSFCPVHWAGATPIWGGQRTRACGRRAWEPGRPQWPAWLCVHGLGLVLPPGLCVWPAEDSQAWESQAFPGPCCQWALKSRAEALCGVG